MSSNKNIYEVFDDFKKAKTKEERLAVLRNNDSWALKNVLMGTFHPSINYVIKKIPQYKSETAIAGLAYNHMTDALGKVYLFVEDHPKVSPNLTMQRKEQLLIQLLESLEPREAEVVIGIFRKDLGVKGLTYKFVKEAFPNLLP